MKIDNTSNYGIAFLSVLIFGIIGFFAMGLGNNGIPVGLIVGVFVGLLVSILIALERIFNILIDKYQIKNED